KESAKSDNEWLKAQLGDQEAVKQADKWCAGQYDRHRSGRVPPLFQEQSKRNGAQPDDRTDRQIDSTGYNQDADAECEDAVQADSLRYVLMILPRAGVGVREKHDRI